MVMMVVLTWYDHWKQNIKLNWVRAWVFSLRYFLRLLWHCTSANEIIAQSYCLCQSMCVFSERVCLYKNPNTPLIPWLTDWVSVCAFIYTINFMGHTLYTQFYGYQFIFKINITSHAVPLRARWVYLFCAVLNFLYEFCTHTAWSVSFSLFTLKSFVWPPPNDHLPFPLPISLFPWLPPKIVLIVCVCSWSGKRAHTIRMDVWMELKVCKNKWCLVLVATA